MMDGSIIEHIYYEVTTEDSFIEDEIYQKNIEDDEKILNELKKILGKKVFFEAEDLIASKSLNSERTGFIMGFKCAMHLLTECGMTKSGVTV